MPLPRAGRRSSLTVTRINGGHADNVLPGACDLLLDRRMVPGENEDEVKAEIDQLLALANERFGVRAEVLKYIPTTGGATETALAEPIVQASLAACREHNHGNAGPFGFQGGCDLVHFRSLAPPVPSLVRAHWRLPTNPTSSYPSTNLSRPV